MKKEEKKEDDNRLKDVIEINQNQNYKIENYKKDNSFRNKNDYYRNKNSRYQYNNKYYNQRQYFNNNYKNDYSQKKILILRKNFMKMINHKNIMINIIQKIIDMIYLIKEVILNIMKI